MMYRMKMIYPFIATVIAVVMACFATKYSPAVYGDFSHLGGIPIGIIGIIGYMNLILCIGSFEYEGYASIKYMIYKILVAVLAPVTIFLIVRSIMANALCPFCLVCWLVNLFLVLNLFWNWRDRRGEVALRELTRAKFN